jgi:hypothetical protein
MIIGPAVEPRLLFVEVHDGNPRSRGQREQQ